MNGNELINSHYTNPSDIASLMESLESWAYYDGLPYPRYNFGPTVWRQDSPLPTPTRHAKIIINESSTFTVKGGSPRFSVPNNINANKFLNEIILANHLDAKWQSLGIDLANTGSIAAKFNFDPDHSVCPVQVSYLSVPQQCRVFTDPADNSNILMARIQYPFRNVLHGGDWFLFREEWTDTRWVRYHNVRACDSSVGSAFDIPGYLGSLGDDLEWTIESNEENPFGMIPLVILRNQDILGSPLGRGTVWGSFRMIDKLALNLFLMDRYSQISSEPHLAITNADIDNLDPLAPGEPISVSSNSKDKPADIKLLEPSGTARAAVANLFETLENHVYKSCGVTILDSAKVSNMGQMSAAALRLLYQDSIGSADQRRQLLGNMGMALLFEKMLLGLSNIGASSLLKGYNPNHKVETSWPHYFAPMSTDINQYTQAYSLQIKSGIKTPERVSKIMAKIEGLSEQETNEIVEEINQSKVQTDVSNVSQDPTETYTEIFDGLGDSNV